MKRIYLATIAASALGLRLLSHAEATSTHTTRAQVRAELIAAEQAGQYPQSYSHYPDAGTGRSTGVCRRPRCGSRGRC